MRRDWMLSALLPSRSMSPSSPISCTHDRGPGTTVCLRCRHDQWRSAQRRRQKMLMQLLALGAVGGLLGVAGVSAASTLRDRHDAVTETSGGTVGAEAKHAAETKRAVVPVSKPAEPAVVQASSTPAPAPAASHSVKRGFAIVEGRTSLTDSIYAMRSGDSVIVNFDAQGYRTRRPDKLERSLRLTLPLVYGRSVTQSFDTVKAGELVTSKDVIGELATTGMKIALDNGTIVHLRVLTRTGRDGPLAVGYVTLVER
jgi:hypothetical protein